MDLDVGHYRCGSEITFVIDLLEEHVVFVDEEVELVEAHSLKGPVVFYNIKVYVFVFLHN